MGAARRASASWRDYKYEDEADECEALEEVAPVDDERRDPSPRELVAAQMEWLIASSVREAEEPPREVGEFDARLPGVPGPLPVPRCPL